MSLLNVDTIEPEGATTDLTLGAGGDKVVIPGTIKISGGSPGADKLLTSDADGDATWVDAASGGFSKYTVVVASIDPFALQSGTTKLIIEVQASGGSAGNADGSGYTGGMGGGGAYAMKLLSPMLDSDTLDITLGAAAGIAASGTTTSVESAGGTTFDAITCDGGNGGVSGSGSYGAGGVGGDKPTTGDFNVAGGNGSGTTAQSQEGQGGAWMARSNYSTDNTLGLISTGYGGGGGGRSATSSAGAAGGAAVVIVWEYK